MIVQYCMCRPFPGMSDKFLAYTQPNRDRGKVEKTMLEYEVFQDMDDPDEYVFVEVYKNKATVKEHNLNRACQMVLEFVPPLLDGGFQGNWYEGEYLK